MTPGTGSAVNYGFDASGNLTTTPSGATGIYDKARELTSSTLSGTTTSYTYSADGQRLSARQGSTTVASGTWNGAHQLTTYSDSAANMTAASYNGNGLRASATFSSASQAFTWNTATTVPELLMDSTNAFLYAASDTPAEQVNLSTGTVTYLVNDALGSVRGIVSSTGGLTASSSYDAWGNSATTGGLTSYTPFGYAGAYSDPTGLLYLINRYYDPATGQFTSIDPLVSQTATPYAYAGGDPISNNDPSGASTSNFGTHECLYYDQSQCWDLKNNNQSSRIEVWMYSSRSGTGLGWASQSQGRVTTNPPWPFRDRGWDSMMKGLTVYQFNKTSGISFEDGLCLGESLGRVMLDGCYSSGGSTYWVGYIWPQFDHQLINVDRTSYTGYLSSLYTMSPRNESPLRVGSSVYAWYRWKYR
jgi:RHS repeat-associated protein